MVELENEYFLINRGTKTYTEIFNFLMVYKGYTKKVKKELKKYTRLPVIDVIISGEWGRTEMIMGFVTDSKEEPEPYFKKVFSPKKDEFRYEFNDETPEGLNATIDLMKFQNMDGVDVLLEKIGFILNPQLVICYDLNEEYYPRYNFFEEGILINSKLKLKIKNEDVTKIPKSKALKMIARQSKLEA